MNLPALVPPSVQPQIGPTVGDLLGSGADAAVAAISHGVTTAALWLLDQVGHILAVTTKPELGSGWFSEHFKVMADVAALVVVPLLLLGIIQSVIRQDASMLVRSVLVHLPLAIILTGVAVQLVQLSLAAVDELSAMVTSATGVDIRHFTGGLGAGLQHPGGSGGLAPAFVVLVVAVAVAFGAFVVWIELLVRTAVISVAVLFLPLALVTLVWPVTAAWCRRLTETIAALILAKLVMVGVLSLAVGALTGGASATPDVAGVVGGATLLVLAASSPFALLRVIPMVEAGAVAHLDGVGRRGASSVLATGGALASVLAGRGGDEGEGGNDQGGASGAEVAAGAPEPADIGKWVGEQAGRGGPPSVNDGAEPASGAGTPAGTGAPDGAGAPAEAGPGGDDNPGAGAGPTSEAGPAVGHDRGSGGSGQGDVTGPGIDGTTLSGSDDDPGAITPGSEDSGPSGLLTGSDSGADSSAGPVLLGAEQARDVVSPGRIPVPEQRPSGVEAGGGMAGPVKDGYDRGGPNEALGPDGGRDVGGRDVGGRDVGGRDVGGMDVGR